MHQDLMYVMRATHEALGAINEAGTDSFLLRTLWSNALTAYARPFKDGVREKLIAADIFTDIEGALRSHTYFLNQRDKLVAHSVNPFEQVAVGVFLDTAGKVAGYGKLAGQLIATTVEGINNLNQLAKIAIEYNKNAIETTKSKLIEEASRLSPVELEQLENVRFVAPNSGQAGESR